ncbi:MAG TPA: DUF4242 domain-containing protein [Dehalococcoidia bacterium]|nr:DUF4242 domain-containing protein [Dehalococcoidia bacterium]
MPRYLIERTFPAGALDGVTDEVKKSINANNASLDVKWIHSYTNADKTKTYCIYEGPHEEAIRKAGELNKTPIDRMVEIPHDLPPY